MKVALAVALYLLTVHPTDKENDGEGCCFVAPMGEEYCLPCPVYEWLTNCALSEIANASHNPSHGRVSRR